MLAQKLDSIRSPFSNQFSKVDILQNSKKKKKKLKSFWHEKVFITKQEISE